MQEMTGAKVLLPSVKSESQNSSHITSINNDWTMRQQKKFLHSHNTEKGI
jgi:hypothetical protein